MKFGISYNTAYYGVDPDRIMAYARHAEDCGFESLYLPEHIALYPGATVGRHRAPAVVALRRSARLPELRRRGHGTDPARNGCAAAAVPPSGGPRQAPGDHRRAVQGADAAADRRARRPARGGPGGGGRLQHSRPSCRRGDRRDAAALGAAARTASASRGSSSPSTTCASSPSPTGSPTCRSTSADRAGRPRRAGRRGDGYFPGGALDPNERAIQWTSPGRPPSRRAAARKRWSTRDGGRSTCPPTRPRRSPHKA